MDAKWHEALKQHEPFSSLQFLLVFLHSLSQKNQTLKEDSCQHDTGKVNKIMHGIFNRKYPCVMVPNLYSILESKQSIKEQTIQYKSLLIFDRY
jgi:hypothetical protein